MSRCSIRANAAEIAVTGSPLRVAEVQPDGEDAGRDRTGYGPVWSIEALHRIVHEQTPRLGWWLDTSEQSVDETVDLLLAHPGRSRNVVDEAIRAAQAQ